MDTVPSQHGISYRTELVQASLDRPSADRHPLRRMRDHSRRPIGELVVASLDRYDQDQVGLLQWSRPNLAKTLALSAWRDTIQKGDRIETGSQERFLAKWWTDGFTRRPS